MSTKNKKNKHVPKRKSKRDRRMKVAIYVMVIAMLLSLFTSGLAFFL